MPPFLVTARAALKVSWSPPAKIATSTPLPLEKDMIDANIPIAGAVLNTEGIGEARKNILIHFEMCLSLQFAYVIFLLIA